MRKFILKIFLFKIFVLLVGIAGVAWWFLLTTDGGVFIVRKAVRSFSDDPKMAFESAKGSLIRGLFFKNAEVASIHKLDARAILKVQDLHIHLRRFSLEGIVVDWGNGRLVIPDSDPILIFGKMENGMLDFNVFTQSFNNRELAESFLIRLKRKVTFDASGIDVQVTGTLKRLHIVGQVNLDQAAYGSFTGTNCPIMVDAVLSRVGLAWRPAGRVVLSGGGEVRGRKTATVHLREGKIRFEGEWGNPAIDLKGHSVVGKTAIDIVVRGNFKHPDILLHSQPPYPRQQLLLMLATNRTWSATEQGIQKGQVVSANVAKEFLDYFIFQGNENQFAKVLGIRSLDVEFDRTKRGFKVIKDVTGNIGAVYGVTQTVDPDNPQVAPQIKQKIGGEYRFNDRISAGFEKEVLPETQVGTTAPVADDRLMIKFQGTF